VLKERRLWLVLGLAAGDAVAGALALVAAYFIRFRADMIPAPLGIPPMEPYLSLLMLLLPLHALALRAVGLYEYRHERTKADEAFVVVQGTTLATLLLVAGTFFFRSFSYSRWFMLVFWAFDVVAVFGVRLAIRDVVRALRRHGRFVRRALVVGAGELGQEVVRRLRAHPEFGVRVVGYLDDRLPVGERIEGREVLGGCEAVTRILGDYRVDQLYLALPLEAHHEVLKVLNAIEGELVDVKMVPDVLQFVTLRAAVEELEGLPVIHLAQSPITGWARLLKRGMDLLLGTIGLLVLAPALGVIALLIRMSSPGPVFYRQERTGLDGRSFEIIKFRTMPDGTEGDTGPVWSTRGDRRPTRLGQRLRRFSLDELPQLWNVVTGDMSLVGPRPERPFFVHQFKTFIPQYMLRHKVKSGLTGWAQVNGLRGDTSLEKRIEYDLYYIQNWSLALDVKILLLTLYRAWQHRQLGDGG
jgi:Undecaprenyl-phosphate glucose phosphotransferase